MTNEAKSLDELAMEYALIVPLSQWHTLTIEEHKKALSVYDEMSSIAPVRERIRALKKAREIVSMTT